MLATKSMLTIKHPMEAPELHLLSDALNAALNGTGLQSFSALAPKPDEPALAYEALIGATLRAEPAGKTLVLRGADTGFAVRFGMKGWLSLYDPAAPALPRRSPEEEKEATDRMTAAEKKAYQHAQTSLLPVPLKQSVAAAPLRVYGSDQVDKEIHNRRFEWTFSNGMRLVLADDSKSASVAMELPAAHDILGVESADAAATAIRAIVKQDRTKFAVLLKNTFVGASEPLISEIFHAARMSPYVSVRDVRDNEAACNAIAQAIHDVPKARLAGAPFAVYARSSAECKAGFGVTSFYFVRDNWVFAPADANCESKHLRAKEAPADAPKTSRKRGAAGDGSRRTARKAEDK